MRERDAERRQKEYHYRRMVRSISSSLRLPPDPRQESGVAGGFGRAASNTVKMLDDLATVAREPPQVSTVTPHPLVASLLT